MFCFFFLNLYSIDWSLTARKNRHLTILLWGSWGWCLVLPDPRALPELHCCNQTAERLLSSAVLGPPGCPGTVRLRRDPHNWSTQRWETWTERILGKTRHVCLKNVTSDQTLNRQGPVIKLNEVFKQLNAGPKTCPNRKQTIEKNVHHSFCSPRLLNL